MFPPFAGTTYCRVGAHLAPLIVMPHIVMLMFALYLLFLPLFSPVDPETDADVPVIDYIDDDPPCLSNQASPPFDHPDIAHSILSCLH